MDDDNLQQVIESCIRCGNNISGRSLNHLSSSIRRWVERSPSELLSIIQTTLIEYDSQIVPTRILLSISNDLQGIDVQCFKEIVQSVISKSTNCIQSFSVISLIHNAVFILPVYSLSETEATQLANNIINIVPNTLHQNESIQVIATALSQFMKKWANSLTNPEILASSLFTLLSDNSFTYATLSLLCQSIVSLILSNKILGDVNLKELIEDLTHHKQTVLDQFTPVSNVNFIDYALRTLPLSAQYQLVGTVIFSLSPEKLNQVANRFSLLSNYIKTPPTDELTRICFYHLLSAVLKATSKQITPKALNMCCNALLKHAETQDHANRHAIKTCFGYLLQCSAHTQNPNKFNEMLFQRILALSPKSVLRQDALPLIIPCVPFSCITIEFFQYLLSLFDKQGSLAMKCIIEVYKNFDVPLEYSTLLFKKLDSMSAPIRTSNLEYLLRGDAKIISKIKEHAINCKEIDENRRLTLLLSTSSFESKVGKNMVVSVSLLKSAIHSWDFEVRMSAIQLLYGQYAIGNEERLAILKDTIPRVFVYCDLKFSKQLERCLDNIVRSLDNNSNSSNCKIFIKSLMSEIQPLLRPYQSGVKKSYIIGLIMTIWRTKPLYLLTKKLTKQLILGLFESSYALRDQFFTLLLFIVRTSANNEAAKSIVKAVINKESEFVTDLIDKNKDSPRFRESDGAARLIALLDIIQKEKPLDFYISEMWIEYLNGSNDSIPSHFPLSVILHILKSNIQNVKVRFFIDKLLPYIIQLITDSLSFMSVEANVEVIPIQQIRNDNPPESQLHSSVNKSWLAVRQSLNIITCIINHYFEEIPKKLVEQIGDTLFRFLIESRHFSTVYYAHLTFQSLCTRCYIRDDCNKFPEKWTYLLLKTADSFSSADHKASDGFVQTATALIHSEPSHLFGSQRVIYHLLLHFCFSSIDNPTAENQLRSALLLTEAIAKDKPTQVNIEPYESQLLMSVFTLYTTQMSYEMRCTANHCLTSLLLKHTERGRKNDQKELDNVAHRELFQSVNGIYDFFIDHLSVDQSDVAYVILQIILIMKPFPQETLFAKIAELKSCRYSHVRRAAARAVLIVIPPNLVDSYAQKCLNELVNRASLPTTPKPKDDDGDKSKEKEKTQKEEKSQDEKEKEKKDDKNEDEKVTPFSSASSSSFNINSNASSNIDVINNNEDDEDDGHDVTESRTNTIDGILLQIEQLCREFSSIKQLLLPQVEDICKTSIKNHITDYIQIYAVISLAREFNCLYLLKPMLLVLFRKRKEMHLMERPLGHQILRATFSVISDEEKAEVLSTNDFGTIFHLIIHILSNKEEISPLIQPLLVNLYLTDKNQEISDYLPSLLSSPTEEQKEQYLQIIYSSQTGQLEDERFESMLNLAPLFVNNAKEVLSHFSQYARFVDRSDSNVLLSISQMMLHFHEQLFNSFDPENENLTHWKIALRILSDENSSIRFPCCKALSFHIHLPSNQQQQTSNNNNNNEIKNTNLQIDLCEFDLVEQIYRLIGRKKSVLEEILQELKEFKEDEGDTHFKKEPTPFLLPSSFHVQLIKQILREMSQNSAPFSDDYTEEDDSDDKEKQREEDKKK
ncbi:hypothetical protein M9Y10_001869 [Tritrichomonas musculus]|uniref:DUF2428 domain-containing protein n=1 Tax=Tritrichomonas musculus TaxID=1915356 RepID=A0ABR2L928_9EUKA